AVAMGCVTTLREDALEAVGPRLLEERLAAPDDVVAVAQRIVRRPAQECREALLALLERQAAEIDALEMQQIEEHVAQTGRGGGRSHRRLETLEARAPVGVEHDDLAVEPRRARWQRSARPRHRCKSIAPVLTTAREELGPAVLEPAE